MLLQSSFIRDLRQAARGLWREKTMSATALGTLALCLAANVVIFTVVRSVVLRPLPFPDPDRLVVVYNSYPKAGVDRAGASWPNYYERGDGAVPAFVAGAAVRSGSVITGDATGPRRVPVLEATPGLLDVLGVPLAMGRFFQNGEEIYGRDAWVVLTDRYWREHYDADPEILGKTIQVNEMPREIIGVLRPGFGYLSMRADFLVPLGRSDQDASPQNRHSNNMEYIARLRPGVSIAAAQAQIDALNAQLLQHDVFGATVADAGFRSYVADLHGEHIAQIRPTLLLLQAAVLFLLLIGVVNLVNLLLVRATGRARELALRQALGAGRAHVAFQVSLETLLLTFGGAAIGLALGAAGLRLLGVLGTDKLPLGATIEFDFAVAAFALGAALVVGLLLAAPLVWFNLHGSLAPILNTESRGGTTTRATHRLRHTLIVGQIALVFVLLASAGLLGLSFRRVSEVQPGFRPSNLITAHVSLPWTNYREPAQRFAFSERLLEELRIAPEIASAGLATSLPVAGNNNNRSGIWVAGHTPAPGESIRTHYNRRVAGDYLQTLGVPLVEGRFFEPGDARGEKRACIVDVDFAQFYWPGESALGRIVYPGPPEIEGVHPHTVVGVVGNVKHNTLADAEKAGALFTPFHETEGQFASYVVARTRLAPEAAAPALRAALARVDPRLPLDDIQTMDTRIEDTLVARRSPMILAALFSVVALCLAAIGIYGVLAYSVTMRTREIGVRMALGALPGQVSNQFLLVGARLLAFGVCVGLAGAFFVGRSMQALLYDISPLDFPVLASTAGALAAVVIAASWLPSRRASRIEPLQALRAD
ncbi:ABC transporter permease [Opitutales bacterium ASA1]|uniref:ADOP family duplicated permease n=1 Tax=Congregicoccus parvus TaxID=3081749 RepID=UPI002B28D20F|nr:ABC transporter permease [Opitutales bacterium ASA1]